MVRPNEDPKKLHVVVGVNGDRVDISWAEKSPNWHMPFMPIETVDENQIVLAKE